MIAATARCHAVFALLARRTVDFIGGDERRASGKRVMDNSSRRV
jgi:hypothetical protein